MVTRFGTRAAAIVAGAAASFAFAGAPARAQGLIYIQAPPNLRVERVSFADLDLATRYGEQALRRRVDQAIGDVCLEDHGRWYGFSEPDYDACRAGAWQRARPQIMGAVYQARRFAYYQGRRFGYYRGY